jgi:hypothetical protein
METAPIETIARQEAGETATIETIAISTEGTKQIEGTKQTDHIAAIGETEATVLQIPIGETDQQILIVETVRTDLTEVILQAREVAEVAFQEETHVLVEVVDLIRNKVVSAEEDLSKEVPANHSTTVVVEEEG